jgi:hypothetical protein
VKKYPFVHTTDSVEIIDTIRIVTEKVSTDTVFQINELPDGVVVEKKNLKIKLRTIKDSIYVYGECDTIFIDKVVERKIPVKYYEINKTNWSLIIFLVAIILILIFIKK